MLARHSFGPPCFHRLAEEEESRSPWSATWPGIVREERDNVVKVGLERGRRGGGGVVVACRCKVGQRTTVKVNKRLTEGASHHVDGRRVRGRCLL